MNSKYIISLLAIFLFLASCMKQEILMPNSSIGGEGNLFLTVPQRPSISTRSEGVAIDAVIESNSVYVLLFESEATTAKLIDFAQATEVDRAGVKSYSIRLPEYNESCYVYIVANARMIVEVQCLGWVKGSTTLGEVATALQTTSLSLLNDVIISMPTMHPMVGGCALSHIGPGISIGSTAAPIAMIPATVKVTVENRVAVGTGYTFNLLGANLGNMPAQGSLFSNYNLDNLSVHHYGKEGNVSSMMVDASMIGGVETTAPLYGYESGSANNSFLILKATYNGVEGYYRLGFFTDSDRQTSRSLLRGMHYKVTIRKVLASGYRTVAEALSSPVSNGIIADINVEDTDSYDIITNGVHYLGVSNSEYIAYNSNYINEFEILYCDGVNNASTGFEMTPFTATVLTYTADPSWNEGIVVASEGIELWDGTNKVSSMVLPLPQIADGYVRRELRVFMSNEFRSGTLDIRIGNLHKVIRVRREMEFSVLGDTILLGRDIAFISGRTLPPPVQMNSYNYDDPKTTYGVADGESASAIMTGDGGSMEVDPSKDLYLQVRNRFRDRNPDYCYGELYLHRNTAVGRTKFSFSVALRGQEIIGDYSLNPPYAIAGAFWRKDQKGERLVELRQVIDDYISTTPFPHIGRWQARVIAGADFIRLSDWDENIVLNGDHYSEDPEQRPVLGDKTHLYGKDRLIRFRIGLTSTNVGRPNRYGLIQLIYLDQRPNSYSTLFDKEKQSCLIFVRQGEDADYVLTPGQTYPTHIPAGNAFTAPDIKFSPYALIDPTLGSGGVDIGDHTQITDVVRPIFAPYPSYTDYIFQWEGDRMIHPREPNQLTNWPRTAIAEHRELCPDGYVTPQGYIDGIPAYYGFRTAFPYGYGNAVSGSYLDGHSDRYRCVLDRSVYSYVLTAPYTNSSLYNSLDYGLLYFDPTTMASLYLPGVARRGGFSGILLFQDRFIDYSSMWALGPDSPGTAYSIDYMGVERSVPLVRSYTGYSLSEADLRTKSSGMRIRCVKDPNRR